MGVSRVTPFCGRLKSKFCGNDCCDSEQTFKILSSNGKDSWISQITNFSWRRDDKGLRTSEFISERRAPISLELRTFSTTIYPLVLNASISSPIRVFMTMQTAELLQQDFTVPPLAMSTCCKTLYKNVCVV